MQSLVKITAAAPTTKLTTLAAAQAECATTADVSLLIDRATAAIMRYCGRAFGLQTVTETFRRSHVYWRDPLLPNRHNNRPLVLHYAYDQVPSSVTIDGGTALIADTDYEIDLEAGMLWRLFSGVRQRWQCSTNIAVVYQTGWNLPNDSSPNLPADVESVCLALVRAAYNNIGVDPSVVLDWSPDIGRTQFARSSALSYTLDQGMRDALSGYVVRHQ